MGIQIKICGINSAEAADAAARAGVDFAGLNFHPRSPRYVAPEAARSLAERMRGRVQLVALICDAGDEQIASLLDVVRPDFLQLHGKETPERVGAVRGRFAVGVIKALAIAEASDFALLSAYERAADMMLFDAKAPAGAERPGGHGAAFDWQLLRTQSFSRPWLLAGGLNAQNVTRALRISGAPGVDVSSGVETAPGVKTAELVAEFVAKVRSVAFAAEADA